MADNKFRKIERPEDFGPALLEMLQQILEQLKKVEVVLQERAASRGEPLPAPWPFPDHVFIPYNQREETCPQCGQTGFAKVCGSVACPYSYKVTCSS